MAPRRAELRAPNCARGAPVEQRVPGTDRRRDAERRHHAQHALGAAEVAVARVGVEERVARHEVGPLVRLLHLREGGADGLQVADAAVPLDADARRDGAERDRGGAQLVDERLAHLHPPHVRAAVEDDARQPLVHAQPRVRRASAAARPPAPAAGRGEAVEHRLELGARRARRQPVHVPPRRALDRLRAARRAPPKRRHKSHGRRRVRRRRPGLAERGRRCRGLG